MILRILLTSRFALDLLVLIFLLILLIGLLGYEHHPYHNRQEQDNYRAPDHGVKDLREKWALVEIFACTLAIARFTADTRVIKVK